VARRNGHESLWELPVERLLGRPIRPIDRVADAAAALAPFAGRYVKALITTQRMVVACSVRSHLRLSCLGRRPPVVAGRTRPTTA